MRLPSVGSPEGVPAVRIRAVNGRPVQPGGSYVLYWMIAARRSSSNFALDRALEWCRELGRPLVVLEALRCDYPYASDRLHRLAVKEFGHLPQGYSRVQAIRDWVTSRVSFQSNSSTGNTTAIDTLVDRVGVCRDFAHLMVALCRAVNIPARFASGIDFGADPALGPTDFHAYVEVFLGDRWYIFDASGVAVPMGFVRLGTGRDAADVAFATMFGGVTGSAPTVQIEAIPNAEGVLVQPVHVPHGLSTDGQSQAF